MGRCRDTDRVRGGPLHPVLCCGLLHGLLVEDLNQLGRRNLTRDQRDALIKRLAASGVRQKDIAEKVGLQEPAVSKIIHGKFPKESFPTVNTTTAAQELQAKQDEIEALRRLSDKMSLNPVSQSPGWS